MVTSNSTHKKTTTEVGASNYTYCNTTNTTPLQRTIYTSHRETVNQRPMPSYTTSNVVRVQRKSEPVQKLLMNNSDKSNYLFIYI